MEHEIESKMVRREARELVLAITRRYFAWHDHIPNSLLVDFIIGKVVERGLLLLSHSQVMSQCDARELAEKGFAEVIETMLAEDGEFREYEKKANGK